MRPSAIKEELHTLSHILPGSPNKSDLGQLAIVQQVTYYHHRRLNEGSAPEYSFVAETQDYHRIVA